MKYGFVRVASAIPSVKVANCAFNREHIEALIKTAEAQRVEIVCFPELSLTAYTCQDLFKQQKLITDTETELKILLSNTRSLNITAIVGLPVCHHGILLNCAAVISKGNLLGIVPKSYLPNYNEFYEMRWFAGAQNMSCASIHFAGQDTIIGNKLIFKTPTCKFGIEICEDVWAPTPPSNELTIHGAELIFNISASNDAIGKHAYLESLLSQQSARCHCGYIYSGAGFGESTQDVVFSGKGFIYENGHLLAEAKRFSTEEQLIVSEIDVERLQIERAANTTFTTCVQRINDYDSYSFINVPISTDNADDKISRTIIPHPFVPNGPMLNERCEEIFNIQVHGLAKRLQHIHCQHAIIGISGGLDSTLALLVCAQTFDLLKLNRKGIIGITMPGFGTTGRTHNNAVSLMQELGVTIREIPIVEACRQHFQDIGLDSSIHDITYENSQARERTQILMDVANQVNGIVVGTGDLSELALGWATYNGDHMSMYGVNASVPKTLARHLVIWTANNLQQGKCRETLLDIADTPISPELIPADADGNIAQKTEDLVGPYELHDFFLYYFLRFGFTPAKIFFLARQAFKGQYTDDTIKKWLTTFCRRFFTQQFKRSCLPDGPKVGSCSLSPRGDWRMPTDADAKSWLDECNSL